MKFKKAPQELVDFLMKKMEDKNCDYKKMFGYPVFFVNGNMFVGLFGDALFLRLSEADIVIMKNEFKEAANLEPMPGRAMKGYVVVPKAVYSNDKLFEEWLDKSIMYASGLPQKGSRNSKLPLGKNLKS
jgi:TfoX/Sxy family transcriptional regulator of competence genes